MEAAERDGVGLALSGGGYRAMLFHAGALWRLNELGWLPKLTTVSSVSGGSIAAGVLAHAWHKLYFGDDGVAENFGKEIVQPLRKLARTHLDVPVTLKAMVIPGRSAGEELARRYAKHLFGDCCLADLDPAGPNFVFTATSLQDGSLWWFFRQPGPHGRVPLATAVAASSAFPPMLSPVVIPDPHEPTRKIVLSDAGVYDNLGLDPIENQRAVVLVSDAGKKMRHETNPRHNWPMQMFRVLTVMDNQVRELRTGSLLKAYQDKQFGGAYWATYSDIENFELPDALPAPAALTRRLAETKTRLTKLPERVQDQLINWGYAACDAGLRRWVDPAAAAPKSFPYPGSGVG
ncbi:MAG TPA: patatin-like phospholipase family protein [Amycolatopsis sp.]|uniref:Patatin-like phospholipase family protein n=1 Tax=Amycolatopsis nalaikhensis TaxID=715472 RepID=A0ABY8XUZ3_9PSEU|nr:patatin-like phospholipase family protein [Amycolatopsis sp. 2-2]WIV59512.1 patatin-like phospholipase family protein [Amycolatopsis sp. 2-2]